MIFDLTDPDEVELAQMKFVKSEEHRHFIEGIDETREQSALEAANKLADLILRVGMPAKVWVKDTPRGRALRVYVYESYLELNPSTGEITEEYLHSFYAASKRKIRPALSAYRVWVEKQEEDAPKARFLKAFSEFLRNNGHSVIDGDISSVWFQ